MCSTLDHGLVDVGLWSLHVTLASENWKLIVTCSVLVVLYCALDTEFRFASLLLWTVSVLCDVL